MELLVIGVAASCVTSALALGVAVATARPRPATTSRRRARRRPGELKVLTAPPVRRG
jgi:hypothetical protein